MWPFKWDFKFYAENAFEKMAEKKINKTIQEKNSSCWAHTKKKQLHTSYKVIMKEVINLYFC